jgi:hypothetical protein
MHSHEKESWAKANSISIAKAILQHYFIRITLENRENIILLYAKTRLNLCFILEDTIQEYTFIVILRGTQKHHYAATTGIIII